jgi:hypothetical protein
MEEANNLLEELELDDLDLKSIDFYMIFKLKTYPNDKMIP